MPTEVPTDPGSGSMGPGHLFRMAPTQTDDRIVTTPAHLLMTKLRFRTGAYTAAGGAVAAAACPDACGFGTYGFCVRLAIRYRSGAPAFDR